MVLQQPFSNQYFRLRPGAYEFVGRLRPDRTVQEVWQECINRFPDDAPGQEAVLQLLSQLYHAHLLHYEKAADSAQLFARYQQRRQREISSRLLNLMFMRFPLLDPDRFLLLGLIMAGVCAVSWVTVPTGKFLVYLASSPRLHRVRWRAVTVTAVLAVLLLLLLAAVPLPSHFRAPGVVQAQRRTGIVNDIAGVVVKVVAQPGSRVSAGQPLLRLTSRELELDLVGAQGLYREAEARYREALIRTNADLKPLNSRLESVSKRLAKLKADQESLVVRAKHDGIWVAPRIHDSVGRRVERGSPLGLLVDPGGFEFVATVAQTDADAAFARPPRGGQVRLRGQSDTSLEIGRWSVVPGGKQTLPSPALGWAAGGEVPVSPNEPEKAREPFFEIRADLHPAAGVPFLHGRSGTIRFDLEPEPLLPRWLRRLQQLLQKRYQL
jgi:putative peptide zinc metalloprotease protein